MAHHVPVCLEKPERWIPKHGLAEKEMLQAWLRFGRDTIAGKLRFLTDDGARFNPTLSATTLGGIVTHLTTVEQHWFQEVLGGVSIPMPFGPDNPDGDWALEDDATVTDLVARYHVVCQESDRLIAELALDSVGAQTAGDYTLRWVLCHVALDTARHAGQADIIREQWDGERGW